MKQGILIAFLIISIALMASATSFEEANTAYKEGNYSHAIELYETLATEDGHSQVHYNLGNAYYKTGNTAKAILHFEKALKYAPDDADVQHNLKIANLMVVDKLEATPEFFLLTWWKQIATRQKANAWTIAFLAFLWISILAFLAFAFLQAGGKKLFFFSGSIGILLAIILLLLAVTRHRFDTNNNNAIIQSSSVSVKSEPAHSGTDLFIIHEGLKVKVLDSEYDWLKIELADGKEGWVSANVLEAI
ncbi:MAG: tetratricopeptide repeat protein [Bacteroidetes bacterium]|nr:tetratricopeptide repeat protein [Bacteroidota bacterium]